MRKLLLAVAAASLLGCGGDSTGPGATSAVGTWNLITVNGSPLPYTAIQVGTTYRLEILSDQFVMSSNGSFNDTYSFRETETGTVTTTTETDTGTWSQNNTALSISYSDGSSSTAAISGNTFTINEEGLVFVYRKQ